MAVEVVVAATVVIVVMVAVGFLLPVLLPQVCECVHVCTCAGCCMYVLTGTLLTQKEAFEKLSPEIKNTYSA